MSALVAAQGLCFAAGGRALVDDASLTLRAGELTIIVGPNGAGKSTLLKLVTGELKASRGSIRYDDRPLAAIPPWRLACKRAVMAQAARMAFPFSVIDAARIGLDGVGRALTPEARERIIAEALALADILHLAERPIQSLSGGEQQRAHFARVVCQLRAGATVETRQTLFLDEPISSLDLKHQFGLMDAAARLAAEGAAVVAVLHDVNLAAAYADQLVVMKDGRIEAAGAPAAIMRREVLSRVFEIDVWRSAPELAPWPVILPARRAATRGAEI